MRARTFIRKCPDGCGKDEYDLGIYRGFHLYQKPFYDGWYVYAELEHPKDELDRLLLKEFEGLSGKICLDTETSEHFTVEKCEQYVIETIDKFWNRKQEIMKPGTLWAGIRIWYPPNDSKGKFYRTKYKGEKFDPEARTLTVEMELIPEEDFEEK